MHRTSDGRRPIGADKRYNCRVTKRPQSNLELIRRVLGDDYLELRLKHLTIVEDSEDHCSATVEALDTNGQTQRVKGEGCGLVDAVMNALLGRYSIEYQSLKSIELVDFRVAGLMETKEQRSGVDAKATVTIDVKNSEGTTFSFSDQSRSIASSSARAALAIVEYFVNAERAFITLYKSRQDAQERHRHDLVSRYTSEMAEVVKSTSYAEVIEKIKKDIS